MRKRHIAFASLGVAAVAVGLLVWSLSAGRSDRWQPASLSWDSSRLSASTPGKAAKDNVPYNFMYAAMPCSHDVRAFGENGASFLLDEPIVISHRELTDDSPHILFLREGREYQVAKRSLCFSPPTSAPRPLRVANPLMSIAVADYKNIVEMDVDIVPGKEVEEERIVLHVVFKRTGWFQFEYNCDSMPGSVPVPLRKLRDFYYRSP